MSNFQKELLLLASTHRTAPLEIRERFAVSEDKIASLYTGLHNIESLEECLVLNTCNRIELYLVSLNPEIKASIEHHFCDFHNFESAHLKEFSFWKSGLDVVSHLFEVSSGIDSQMVGETEITGQVKVSYQTAAKMASVGPVLHKLFQKCFQSTKWVRSNTSIGKGQVSVGNVAVDLALRIFGDLTASRILVIGTGEVGEKTVRALKSRGARSISVCGRTYDHAESLAESIGAQAIAFEDYPNALANFDIIACSTASTEILITASMIESAVRKRSNLPMFFIDLAVPRDIETRVANIPNVFLYNLDDLAEIANENLNSRIAEIDRCRQILQERAKRLWSGFENDGIAR